MTLQPTTMHEGKHSGVLEMSPSLPHYFIMILAEFKNSGKVNDQHQYVRRRIVTRCIACRVADIR